MAEKAQRRLSQLKNMFGSAQTASSIPWNPDCTSFPRRKDLPHIPGAPEGAAWVWGEDDNIGRLNLLTPTRVKASAATEIQCGEMVSLNLPLKDPAVPGFGREPFQHTIKTLVEDLIYDDLYTMNTQSGTQWDGFRHFAHLPSKTFYNNAHGSDFVGPNANDKCSIHHWQTHGIAGRGVLIDYASYAAKMGIQYDCYESYAVSWDELFKCGKDQGLDIRPEADGGDIKIGDLLFIRSGWIKDYYGKSKEESAILATRKPEDGTHDGQKYAGIKQEDKMIDWLHDSYFSAVAGDAPAFECWPSEKDYHLHEYLLALWGCPLGEMLDLEKLSEKCKEKNRWTFFVSSVPANCNGGVGSHPNAMAIF